MYVRWMTWTSGDLVDALALLLSCILFNIRMDGQDVVGSKIFVGNCFYVAALMGLLSVLQF